MSRRFPGVELTEWRSRLIDTFAGLFPDARPELRDDGHALYCDGWPAVPDGWRELIERACSRIEAARSEDPSADVSVAAIEERRGSLRLHVSCVSTSDRLHAAVELAVELAEARAEQTCAVCGMRGRLWHIWAPALCDFHGEGPPLETSWPAGVCTITRFVEGKPSSVRRTYRWEDDTFHVVPVDGWG